MSSWWYSGRLLPRLTRRTLLWIPWAAERVGYWVRPYDMLADRRRWFWQPRERCQWSQRQITALRKRDQRRGGES